ncbi:hypothetical protein MYX04_13205, partial [Nitrospiraceae bacterium AH_259_D15_M11_P09]|nr:hypothetical protein [Nitrospiraceae bacterium AH_259_D15_M11_P09]
MDHPLILPLQSCSEPTLVGGKAATLGHLIRNGFHIPLGVCVTTRAYQDALCTAGVEPSKLWAHAKRASEPAQAPMLEEYQRIITSIAVPSGVLEALSHDLDCLEKVERSSGLDTGSGLRWAVRSSATNEDTEDKSFAGLYRTTLGVERASIERAILQCWASLWTPPALAYQRRAGQGSAVPAMAVIIQPLLSPKSAGVAYSRHPVTGQADLVVINAVLGLAEPLVSGVMTPDHYVMRVGNDPMSVECSEREIAEKTTARTLTPFGPREQALPLADRWKPVLADSEVAALATLVKEVERDAGRPVDVEWAIDHRGTWLLQARPIPRLGSVAGVSENFCAWSRANLKETLPELPCPLTLSFVHAFMENNILRHYRAIGCRIPDGVSSTRVIRGRPYLNVTLFQSLMAQIGGDPTHITEQMGGEAQPVQIDAARLPWWRLLRTGGLLQWRIWTAGWRASARFAELKRLGLAQTGPGAEALTERGLKNRLEWLQRTAQAGDLTFAIVAGVAQALYMLGLLLPRRLKENWRPLLNAATQGLGDIVSANQILWLVQLAEQARGEPAATEFLLGEPWSPGALRDRLEGTNFIKSLDAYLGEYGHRALGESDVMSPRFAETPEYLLAIIRGHLQSPTMLSVDNIRQQQAAVSRAARARIRAVLAERWHEWAWFRYWHRVLCRYLALREANRHYLAYYVSGFRRLLLELGAKLAARGLLASGDDLFFLTQDEVGRVLDDSQRDWRGLVATRRAERAHHATLIAPDFITPTGISGKFRPSQAGTRDLSEQETSA